MERTCLFVLGMHRSGTSATAGALCSAGISFGDNFIDKKPENPRGFFEDARINRRNSRLLAERGLSWYSILPKKKLHTLLACERSDDFIEDICQYLDETFPEGIFAIKEPRCCLLLPLYNEVFERLGIRVRALVVRRDYDEVAMSLHRRDQIPRFYGFALANFYNQLIDDGVPRFWNDSRELTYSRLLSDPEQEISSVLDWLGIAKDESKMEGVREFLDPALRHGDASQHSGIRRRVFLASSNFIINFAPFDCAKVIRRSHRLSGCAT
ncbi:MAG: hypothetical protein AAGG48_14175 [Planctomycetota bacterium]